MKRMIGCLICAMLLVHVAQLASAGIDQRPEVFPQLGHAHGIQSVAFSPDGCLAFSGSFDTTLRLWDIATGRELRRFEGHGSFVNSVAFSPDGRSVLSGSGDKILRLCDVRTGRELRRFEGHAEFSELILTPQPEKQ